MNLFEAIRNVDWKVLSIGDVIEGCASEYLSDFNILRTDEQKEWFRKITLYRSRICANCHMNSDGWCDNSGTKTIINVVSGQPVIGCGCNLRCKNALLSKACPASLWLAVTRPK